MRLLAIIGLGFAVVALAAMLALTFMVGSGRAFDRQPKVIAGLQWDQWGQTATGAQSSIRTRYALDSTVLVYCAGAIIAENPAVSSFVRAGTRFWDKLWCITAVAKTVETYVFDQKGPGWNAFRIYRLRVSALR